MNLFKKCIAEFIGAFAIVFAGCGAIAVSQINPAVSHLTIAATFGLVVLSMIYAAGHVSGAHFNPAVTIAFAFTRHFPKKQVLPYIISQIIGCFIAALLLKLTLSEIYAQKVPNATSALNVGVTNPIDGLFLTAFIWEFLLTFLLMFVIMSVATDYRAIGNASGIAIGGVVFLEAAFAGPICNASMNPARSIGPAIVAQDYQFLLAYIIGPVLGAVSGAFVYAFIRCEESKKGDIKGCC